MATEKLCVKISWPWWMINLYLPTLILFGAFCQLFNSDIHLNKDKLAKFLASHVKVSGIKAAKNG